MKFLKTLTKEIVYIPIILVLSFLYELLFSVGVNVIGDLWNIMVISFNFSSIFTMKIVILVLIIKALYFLIKKAR